MTRFEIIHLPCTQQEDILFTIKINDSCTNCTHQLTFQAGISAESCPGCFCCGLFLRLVWHTLCSGGLLQMALSPCGKQTASCNSPHDWLMSLAMDFAAFCDYVEAKCKYGTSGCYLAVFGLVITYYAWKFVATHLPTLYSLVLVTPTPIIVMLVVLAMPVKII